MEEQEFSAKGPPRLESAHPEASFSNMQEQVIQFKYGVNVEAELCGVFAVAGIDRTHAHYARDAPYTIPVLQQEGVYKQEKTTLGVYGFAARMGVFGVGYKFGIVGRSYGSGTGVEGFSVQGRGGVFASATMAQLYLLPKRDVPQAGKPGDFFVKAIENDTMAQLFFCRKLKPDGSPIWSEVSLEP